MKIIISLIGLISLESYFAQNLIPNPSFEDTIPDCHYQRWVNPGTPNVNMATGWFQPSIGTPDLFAESSRCPYTNNGIGAYSIFPQDGFACAGLQTYNSAPSEANYREYLGIRLKSKLQNKYYCFSAQIAFFKGSAFISNNLGIEFSPDSLYQGNKDVIELMPDFHIQMPYDDTSWKILEFDFLASGTEEFLYIGNFFVDDSTLVYPFSGSYQLSYYLIDNLSLTLCPGQEPEEHFSLYPNPSDGNALYIDKFADTTANVYLYNSIGQQVGIKELPTGTYRGVVFEHLAAGVYILIYETAEGYYEERKVVVVK